MRIGLVADTFSVEKGTGIARYSQELRRGLADQGLSVEPICPVPPNLPFGLAMNHAVRMPYLVRRKAGRLDLIHATSPITALAFPLITKPKVVTYFDLVSLLCDKTSSAFHTRLFAPLFLRIGRFADRAIAISTQTKQEMIAHLGIAPEKIAVVSPGVGHGFRYEKKGKGDAHVIGYVGALNRRKAIPYLIRAIHILRASHPRIPAKLVICGNRDLEYGRLVTLVGELGLSQVVEFMNSPTDDELVEAYNCFDVFVLPSECEGFGLPILEAQRCGVPVIIRDDAHIPAEVSKCCLKARSEQDMADKIYELLTNENVRQDAIQRGVEHSQQFTWERTVQETLTIYEEAMS